MDAIPPLNCFFLFMESFRSKNNKKQTNTLPLVIKFESNIITIINSLREKLDKSVVKISLSLLFLYLIDEPNRFQLENSRTRPRAAGRAFLCSSQSRTVCPAAGGHGLERWPCPSCSSSPPSSRPRTSCSPPRTPRPAAPTAALCTIA